MVFGRFKSDEYLMEEILFCKALLTNSINVLGSYWIGQNLLLFAMTGSRSGFIAKLKC